MYDAVVNYAQIWCSKKHLSKHDQTDWQQGLVKMYSSGLIVLLVLSDPNYKHCTLSD
jgi:hypothetical protein